MKHKCALILCLFAAFASAQNPPVSPQVSTSRLEFPVYGLNAVPVSGANIQVIGQPGNGVWFIWGVSNYQIGSVMVLLGVVTNAPTVLSAQNYLAIYANYPTGGVTVDFLATQTALQPSGACGCAIATGVTTGVVNFQSNSLNPYTVSLLDPTQFMLYLTNEVVGSGSSHLLLRMRNGTLVADLSVAGTGTVGGSGTANFIPVWTGTNTLGNSTITATAAQIQFGQGGSPLTSTIGMLAQVFPNPANCGGSATVPITVNPPYGCIGSRILQQVRAGTSSGATAGLSVEARPTNFVAGTLGVGISALVASDLSETEERAFYAQAWENSSTPTVGTRRAIFGLAVNATGNTTALNEGIIAMSGSTSGTNTNDMTFHVYAPSTGGTLTRHAGIEIDAQTVGVQLRFGTQAFSALPACSATYDGSTGSITDATSATNGTVVTGGGAHHDQIYCNGTSWVVVAGT